MPASNKDIEKTKTKIKHELKPFMNKNLSLSDEALFEFGEEYRSYIKKI